MPTKMTPPSFRPTLPIPLSWACSFMYFALDQTLLMRSIVWPPDHRSRQKKISQPSIRSLLTFVQLGTSNWFTTATVQDSAKQSHDFKHGAMRRTSLIAILGRTPVCVSLLAKNLVPSTLEATNNRWSLSVPPKQNSTPPVKPRKTLPTSAQSWRN